VARAVVDACGVAEGVQQVRLQLNVGPRLLVWKHTATEPQALLNQSLVPQPKCLVAITHGLCDGLDLVNPCLKLLEHSYEACERLRSMKQ